MSTPTPIEVVRAHLKHLRLGSEHSAFCLALASILADAERFQALERAHDGRSVYAMCIESHDEKARFTGYDLVECPLAELADRLREGAT